MMAQTLFLFLLLLCKSSAAQQPPPLPDGQQIPPPKLTVENINRQTEVLRNPGVLVADALQVPESQELPAPATLNENPGRISDPTQMTGSFSQALNRINAKPGQPGQNGPAMAAPALPDIRLVAKAIHHHDDKSVMLHVAGKTRMVRQGSKFSFVENNMLYEIQVNKIEKDHVEITLMPMGRQITLE